MLVVYTIFVVLAAIQFTIHSDSMKRSRNGYDQFLIHRRSATINTISSVEIRVFGECVYV